MVASRGKANWFQARVLSLLLVPGCVLCPLSALCIGTSSKELNRVEGGWEPKWEHSCPSLSLWHRQTLEPWDRLQLTNAWLWAVRADHHSEASVPFPLHWDHQDIGTKTRVTPRFSTPPGLFWSLTVSYNPLTFQIPFFWMVTRPCKLFVCVCCPIAELVLLDFPVHSLIR